MTLLVVFGLVFSILMSGEVPIPSVEVAREIKPQSEILWNKYKDPWSAADDNKRHVGKTECANIVNSYNSKFRCFSYSNSNIEKTLPSEVDNKISSIINSLIKNTVYSETNQLLKISGYNLLDNPNSTTVNKIYIGKNGYELSNYGTKQVVREDLTDRFKRFARLYDCKSDYDIKYSNIQQDINGQYVYRAISRPLFYVDYPITDSDDIIKNKLLTEEWKAYLSSRGYDNKDKVMPSSNTKFLDEYFSKEGCIDYCTDALTYNIPRDRKGEMSCGPIRISAAFQANSTSLIGNSKDIISLAKEDKKYGSDNKYNIRCIENSIKANQNSLKRVKILASSSSDSNGKPLCSKDFIGLSKQRTLALKEMVRTYVLGLTKNQQGENGIDIDKGDLWQIDYYGENKDGTSGPCAYVAQNGVMSTTPNGNVSESLLKDYRSAEIQLFFTQANNSNSGSLGVARAGIGYEVRDLTFSCKDSTGDSKFASSSTIGRIFRAEGKINY